MPRRLLRSKRLLFSLAIVLAVFLGAIFAPQITDYDPTAINPRLTLRAPMPGHPLGTDEFGRDILSRLLYGARPTLIVATAATAGATLVGVTLGLLAGYYRGPLEILIMRAADVLLCIPPIVLAMMVVGFLGPSILNLTIVIGVLSTPTFVRLSFAETIRVREMDYVKAAESVGARDGRILLRHLLPNITAPVIVQFSLTMASAILLESGLSFLGLGVVQPTPSWGLMIATARGYMSQAPTYILFPSLTIAVTILAINTIGDTLRDLLDPRLRRSSR